jgi:type II secretory pathway component PulF
MPTFDYTALSAAGERVAGVLAAGSEQAVLAELEAKRLTPVAIEARAEGSAVLRRRISVRKLAMSYSQLADLVRAGVPLLRGLRLLAGRKSQPRLAAVFRELADAVAEGEELAAAMAKRPEIFPKVQVAMVRAGEKGGFLEAVLTRLGQFLLSQAELRSKVVGNMVYPSILMVFGTVVLGVIFGVFVPMFRPMFDQMGDKLPAVTKFVFGASRLVGTYGPVVVIALVLGGAGLLRVSRRPDVRRKLAEVRTWMPVVGPLTRSLAAARFCRMLGTMLGNGIPMLAAMQIARDAAGNVLMEEAIDKATEAVRAGQPLAPPLSASGLFQDDVIEMISVGESANNLDEVLTTIAGTIETRVDRLLSSAVRLIEPLMLVVLAGVVVVVAMALVLPMTHLSDLTR